jgi:HlyD family secretion protein
VIYSPMAGTVSSRTSEVGERVAGTGQFNAAEVMRVADLSSMEVRVNVNENDVVNVKVGDRARVNIDAYPGRRFAGAVKEIASAAKTLGLSTQEEVTNFQVKIRITDKDVALRPGMSASVDIETRTVENVIAVPIQAVTVRSREGSKTLEELAGERDRKARETQGEAPPRRSTKSSNGSASGPTAKGCSGWFSCARATMRSCGSWRPASPTPRTSRLNPA